MENMKAMGYVKECKIVDCKGASLGEAPHYTFQLLYPIEKELYLSDNITEIESSIFQQLQNENIIEDIKYDITIEGGMIEIYDRKLKNLFK